VLYDFVSAFNLILIEYDKTSPVRGWHNKFLEHVCNSPVKAKEELSRRNQEFNVIITKLIEEIAKSINIQIEQLDITNKIYWPQGFVNLSIQQQKLLELLIQTQEQTSEILTKINNRSLGLAVFPVDGKSK
jgi:hypothetical protein